MGHEMVKLSPATRNLWLAWDLLVLDKGVLCRKCPENGINCLVVPRQLQTEVLRIAHGSLLSGHLGQRRTMGRLVGKFYWFQLREAVANWVKKCSVCSSNTRASKKPRGPLGVMQVGAPLDRIGTDLLGPLPLTPRGNRHILVVQDYFTKWVEIYPVPDATAETCAHYILNHFVARFGIPYSIHSDQGRSYEADLMYQLCDLLGMKKTRTSPRHPACNGMVERFNQTVIKMIRAFIDGKQNNWDLYLGCLAGAYRSSLHESTGYTPNMLMLGREVRIPVDLLFEQPKHPGVSYGEFVESVQHNLCQAHHQARKWLGRSAERQEENYNTRIALNTYRPGDLVWILNETRKPGCCPKLQNMWAGPYLVQTKFSDLTYKLILGARLKSRVVHHDKMKPYRGEVIPQWVPKAKQDLGMEV